MRIAIGLGLALWCATVPALAQKLDPSTGIMLTIPVGPGGSGTGAQQIPSSTHGLGYISLAANTSTALSSLTPGPNSGSLAFPLTTQAITLQVVSINTNTASLWLCQLGGTCVIPTLGAPAGATEITTPTQAASFSVSAAQSASPTIVSSQTLLVEVIW
jgi:hypothetical protein